MNYRFAHQSRSTAVEFYTRGRIFEKEFSLEANCNASIVLFILSKFFSLCFNVNKMHTIDDTGGICIQHGKKMHIFKHTNVYTRMQCMGERDTHRLYRFKRISLRNLIQHSKTN